MGHSSFLGSTNTLVNSIVFFTTHCNTLQHAATLCNILQHTATFMCVPWSCFFVLYGCVTQFNPHIHSNLRISHTLFLRIHLQSRIPPPPLCSCTLPFWQDWDGLEHYKYIHVYLYIYMYIHIYKRFRLIKDDHVPQGKGKETWELQRICTGLIARRGQHLGEHWRHTEWRARVLQCVAGCYSVLQSVAVCCSVLQCVAVLHRMTGKTQ